jgi:hypothetical protein
MVAAARQLVIVSEPVRSVIHGGNVWMAALAGYLTDPGNGNSRLRFTDEKLRASIMAHTGHMESSFLIPGGRERVYVLNATTCRERKRAR